MENYSDCETKHAIKRLRASSLEKKLLLKIAISFLSIETVENSVAVIGPVTSSTHEE